MLAHIILVIPVVLSFCSQRQPVFNILRHPPVPNTPRYLSVCRYIQTMSRLSVISITLQYRLPPHIHLANPHSNDKSFGVACSRPAYFARQDLVFKLPQQDCSAFHLTLFHLQLHRHIERRVIYYKHKHLT